MKKENKQFIKGTYRPRKNYWRRDYAETHFKRLYREAMFNEYKGDLQALSDRELLEQTNIILHKLGLQVYTEDELNRELSLKY